MDRVSEFVHNMNLRDKRNVLMSILAGALFTIGWWFAIDAAAAFPQNEQLMKASHACGALATLAFIMINSVTNNQIRGESMYSDGCFGKTGARIWIFLAFLMSFGSLIASFWIFFSFYVSAGRAILPGLLILAQNVFIFASTLVFKFGRSEDLWGN